MNAAKTGVNQHSRNRQGVAAFIEGGGCVETAAMTGDVIPQSPRCRGRILSHTDQTLWWQVKRHLEFVDQLVKDKAELSSRCERLVEDLKLLERKFEQRQQEAEERAQRELKKQRESILAAEKMRRDAWMQARQSRYAVTLHSRV